MRLKNILQKKRQVGTKAAVKYYAESIARRMSTNYRQYPERFSQTPLAVFVPFLCFDYARLLLDRVTQHIDTFFNQRMEIPKDELQEFTVRLLIPELLNRQSIVYAFGVSRHIETEEDIVQRIGCDVHLFDPTPPALEFVKQQHLDKRLKFNPIGVWTESRKMKFFFDRRSHHKNLSVVNMYGTENFMKADCYTLQDIMQSKQHKTIDLLKMDIEGSALPVLMHMLECTDIRPKQIIGALERPSFVFGASPVKMAKVVIGKRKLLKALSREHYKVLTHHAAEFTAIRL